MFMRKKSLEILFTTVLVIICTARFSLGVDEDNKAAAKTPKVAVEEAETWIEQNLPKGEISIKERPREYKRCQDYCECLPFCDQARDIYKEKVK